MKIPKCPKTVTGKHNWQTEKVGIVKILDWSKNECEWGVRKITPICLHCGLIDDSKKVK